MSHALAVVLLVCITVPSLAAASDPPVAARRPVSTTLHGDTRVDDYAWLREKESPATIAYLESENAYALEMMQHTSQLQAVLYDEMLGRIKQTDLTAPYRHGPYWYYTRTVEGRNYRITCRRKGSMDAPEEIVLDENELATGHDYFRITARDLSPDHTRLVYAVDTTGYEIASICVKNLETGETTENVVTDAAPWGLCWAADGKTFFYSRFDDSKRLDRIYRHEMGTDSADDVLVFQEDDVRFNASVRRSRSNDIVFFGSSSSTTSELWFVDARRPAEASRVIAPRRQGVQYTVDHHPAGGGDGVFYIRTDAGGAPNFRVVRAPVDAPDRWDRVISHDESAYITSVGAFRDHLVLNERRDGYAGLRIIRLDDGVEHVVEMPEVVGVARGATNPEFDTESYRFSYSSLVTPRTVFEYDLETRERTLLKQQEVLGGYDPANYTTGRQWATAPDGTRVPISIVHRVGLELDGARPCLLYGYGSYGSSMDPWFRSDTVSLLDRGFVYAVAHIRGGAEMGRRWKEDGKMLKKRNTFTDFIACAEHLIDAGYTNPDRLAIKGGSAGGLLMGAVVNMRPDLFSAAHAAVPFVDVVNTMLDASIPLTTGEYEEWGNPEDATYYTYMKSYSPYDNVAAQDYPDLLITAGLNDPRVHYWEPAKWAAKLRATRSDDGLLILKTNMGAGHGGASGRYDRYKEVAFEYAFVIDRVGVPSAESATRAN